LPLRILQHGLQIYLSDLVWRTTPLSWLGFVLGVAIALATYRADARKAYGPTVLFAAILGVLFILLFSIQRGPKPPHYILTAYVSMDLIAGLGWSYAVDFLSSHRRQLQMAWLTGGAFTLLLGLQLISILGFYPYYISYYNPFIEALQPGIQNPTLRDTGYGVGLDQAAAYLARKPGASQMTVMSANGLGSFSYYFPGKTLLMNSLVLTDPQVIAGLKDSQYVVVDYYNQRRHHLLTGLEGLKPEKAIWINGINFLHIYRAADVLARVNATQP
jgi:4-amino-4-deoxy-L-arabinose transferase-like glycosyltransferase